MNSHLRQLAKPTDQAVSSRSGFTEDTHVYPLIDALRHKIDLLDSSIISLLGERNQMSQAVQYFKHAASLPAYQPQREKEVLDRVTLEARKSGLPVDLIREVYLLIVRQYVDSTPPYIVHTSLPTKHHGD